MDDLLTGTAVSDTLTGLDGNDTIEGLGGGDSLDGGADIDTLSYANSGAGVSLMFVGGNATLGGGDAAGDTVAGFENFIGSNFGDVIDVNIGGANNILEGLGGNDRLFGRGGTDQVFGGAGDDTLSLFSSDLVSGETYDGGADFDTLELVSGASALFDFSSATVTGIEKLDIFHFGGSVGVTVTLTATQAASISEFNSGAAPGGAEIIQIDMGAETSFFLSGAAIAGFNEVGDGFVITGDADSETIFGSSVNDTILGGDGVDFIAGGNGADSLDGGAGLNDYLSYEGSSAGVNINIDINTASGGDANGDTISGFENLVGSGFDDILAAGGVDNVIFSSSGNDTLFGGGGVDFLFGDDGNDFFGEFAVNAETDGGYDGGTGTDELGIAPGGVTASDLRMVSITSVEQLYVNAEAIDFNIRLTAQQITANFGEIFWDGHAGFTRSIEVDMGTTASLNLSTKLFTGTLEPGDHITINGDGDDEMITGSVIDDSVNGGAGADSIKGGLGVDTLIGGSGDDTLRGEDGNDFLFSGLGKDRADGGAGDDYIRTSNGNDTLLGGAGVDTLGAGSGTDLLRGGDDADLLLASNGKDRLYGNAGDDTMLGGGGRDTLTGGAGNDRLVGGTHNDRFNFTPGSGADLIVDFEGGAGPGDVIGLIGFGPAIDTFAELMAVSMQVGNNVVINLGGGDAITLQGVMLANLNADDFAFG